MIIESNGITIERLREKDIEMVRKWRNSRFVKQFMIHQETITIEMQKEWFKSVDNFNNFYFLIIYKGKKVGLGNVKNIDWEKKEGEAGIFITKQRLVGSILPIVGSLTLSDIVYKLLRLTRITAQIRQDNPRAKKLSKLSGSQLAEGQEGKESQLYYITKDAFYKATKKFFALLAPLGFSTGKMNIHFDKYDFDTGFADKFIKFLDESELRFERTEKEGIVVYKEIID